MILREWHHSPISGEALCGPGAMQESGCFRTGPNLNTIVSCKLTAGRAALLHTPIKIKILLQLLFATNCESAKNNNQLIKESKYVKYAGLCWYRRRIWSVFWFVLAAKLMINEGKTYIGWSLLSTMESLTQSFCRHKNLVVAGPGNLASLWVTARTSHPGFDWCQLVSAIQDINFQFLSKKLTLNYNPLFTSFLFGTFWIFQLPACFSPESFVAMPWGSQEIGRSLFIS